MCDSDAATSKFAEKWNSCNFIQRMALAFGLQQISVHIGVWMTLSLVAATGVFAVFSDFVLKHTVAAISRSSIQNSHIIKTQLWAKIAFTWASQTLRLANSLKSLTVSTSSCVWHRFRVAANFCSHRHLDANRSSWDAHVNRAFNILIVQLTKNEKPFRNLCSSCIISIHRPLFHPVSNNCHLQHPFCRKMRIGVKQMSDRF